MQKHNYNLYHLIASLALLVFAWSQPENTAAQTKPQEQGQWAKPYAPPPEVAAVPGAREILEPMANYGRIDEEGIGEAGIVTEQWRRFEALQSLLPPSALLLLAL